MLKTKNDQELPTQMEVDGIVVVDNFEASSSTNIEHDFSMNSNASYEKLVDYPVVSNELNKNKVASAPVDFKGGYQIVDVDTLASTFKIFACPECLHVGHVDILKLKKQGLAFQFQLRDVIHVNGFIIFGLPKSQKKFVALT